MSREKLMGLLWPESDDARGRNLLNVSVYELRKALGERALLSTGDDLRLNPEVVGSDVADVDAALARGDHEAVVRLYRGPLLDGFFVDDAPDFERWAEGERARVAAAYARSLEALAEAAEARADLRGAAEWWRLRSAHDPLDSRVAASLMRALDAGGNRAGALQHAALHERLLREELGVAPGPEVAALARRLRAEPAVLTAVPATPAVPAAVAEHEPRLAQAAVAEMLAPATPETPANALPPARTDEPRDAGRGPRVLTALVAIAGLAAVIGAAAIVLAGRREAAARATAAAPAARSVAVLPFVNMSGDSANAYFSDGLSEDLITALSHVDGLRVAARTSSFALRNAGLDVRTIGDTLGVATVLEGSVRREGARLRVTAQLIDARSGYHLWAATYDRDLKDVFAVQDEIAAAIAGALRLRLGGTQRPAMAARPANPEAYDLYLRGNWFRSRLSRDAIFKAIEYYDRAIASDPDYARAHAGKALAMGPLVFFAHADRDSALAVMRAAAERALALDERLGEAHVAMGMILYFLDWNWPAAERELRRAIELEPENAHAYHHLGNYLVGMERMDEGLAARRRALELDPLNSRTLISVAGAYMVVGQYDRALEYFRRTMDVDSLNGGLLGLGPAPPVGPGEVLERQGRHREAADEYVRVAARRGATASVQRALRQAFADGGMPGFWRRWLEFDTLSTGGRPRAIRVGAIYARMGDRERAIAWLQRAFRERDPGFVFVGIDLDWQLVRRDPRVQAMVDEMRRPR